MKALRIGIIGAGRVAQAYAQALSDSSRIELGAVVDIDFDAARVMAEPFEASVFENVGDAIESGAMEAAILCTPPFMHAPIAGALLSYNIPVLCETPLALHSEEAQAMAALSFQNGCLLAMASKFRFVEDVQRVKRLVTAGDLGAIVLCRAVFSTPMDMAGRWNSDPTMSGGGVLMDNGPSALDLIRFLLGPFHEIQASEGPRVLGLEVEDTVHLVARMESGSMATVDLSWAIAHRQDTFLEVYGSRGAVSIGWGSSWSQAPPGGKWQAFGKGYDKRRVFRAQLEHFARAVLGQEPTQVPIEETLDSVRAVETAYASIHLAGVPVRVAGAS